jgi:phospholipase D1/2
LRRPPEENEEFRLDRLLKRKAEEGVKIYIVVYKEMSQVLTIDSAHTKKHLQGLHKNILGKAYIYIYIKKRKEKTYSFYTL